MADDDRVTALARSVDRTGRRVDAIDQQLAGIVADVAQLRPVHEQLIALAADVARLADLVAPGADGLPPAVRSWLQPTDPQLAREDLAALCDWATDVYLQYPDTALPSCWLWHPWAVEELLWLRSAHAAAYTGPDASWRAVADWHDRHRPGVTRRLRDALRACDLSQHEPGRPRHRAPAAAPLTYAHDEIATAWLLDRAQPDPIPRHLADADQHETDQEHRTRS